MFFEAVGNLEIGGRIDRFFGASVINVGLGRQRRRLSLYINMAPLCGNGRGLRTHQRCDLGFEGPAGQGRGGLIFEPPRERRFKDQTSEGALLRPFFGPVKKCVFSF